MDILLSPAPSILPPKLLQVNLIEAFIWYVTGMFFLSLFARLRFYASIYEITRYVAGSCPNVFRLVHEHWVLCVRDRFLWLVAMYGFIFLAYLILSRLVWPQAYVNVAELAEYPWVLLVHLTLVGLMVAIDLVLTLQTSVIDRERVINDLKFAEGWLGGRFYAALQVLGRWNPIKNYADNLTAQTMLWSNILFRGSMGSMILQTAMRVMVGCGLFASHALLTA